METYKTGEFLPQHRVWLLSYVLDLYVLVSTLGSTKTRSSGVVNMLSRCFRSAFSDYCVVAEQELLRRSQLLEAVMQAGK